MYERLFIGNKLLRFDEVDSTNAILQKLLVDNKKEVEGTVVVADNQYSGKGQRGSSWESEKGNNLTFSIFLKPNIEVKNQFLISKIVSLGVIDFLENNKLKDVKIKWPNDIYHKDKKLSGILIENSISGSKIYNSIIGIGLNVNQRKFSPELAIATSLINILGGDKLQLEEKLNELLYFIEKRYLLLKNGNLDSINNDYLNLLYGFNQLRSFQVNDTKVEGVITGTNSLGKLQVKINDKVEEFDLKEIKFLA